MRLGALRTIGSLSVVAALATGCAKPAASARAESHAPDDLAGEWDVRWDRGFAGWSPSIFDGRLIVTNENSKWTAKLSFRESHSTFSFVSLARRDDQFDVVFRTENKDVEFRGWLRDGRLIGEMRWGTAIGWTPAGGHRSTLPKLVDASVAHSLPHQTRAESGAHDLELDNLLEDARTERSSAVVLVKDGRIVTEVYRDGYDGGPLLAMSASKSIVSLAIGMLIAEKKLTLDTRMDALFPEWRDLGAKSGITVRQLLTQTSGLDPSRASSKESIRAHALAAKLMFAPGTRFQYNNGGADFLALVVKQVAGVSLDAYLETHLFRKLDVVDARWMTDVDGTPRGAGELAIRPVDLAKIGQMMLDEGRWNGEQIVPLEWAAQSIDAQEPFEADYGFLWWREGTFAYVLDEATLAEWRDLGLDEESLKAARSILGKKIARRGDYLSAVAAAIGPDAYEKLSAAMRQGDHIPIGGTVAAGEVDGFSARGWLGQQLLVFPKKRIVAVRMRVSEKRDYKNDGEEHDGYLDFADDVRRAF